MTKWLFLIRKDWTKQVPLKSMREKISPCSHLAEFVRPGQEYNSTSFYTTDKVPRVCLHVSLFFFFSKWSYIKKRRRTNKWNWLSFSEVDEPRISPTEWSKSKRKANIIYEHMYVWNLEKRYWWTYLQGRNRDAGIKNGLRDTAVEGEGGSSWESSINIYTLPCVEWIASGTLPCNTGSSTWSSVRT